LKETMEEVNMKNYMYNSFYQTLLMGNLFLYYICLLSILVYQHEENHLQIKYPLYF